VGSYKSTKTERRGEELKYIVFWEFCPEDMDKVIKKTVNIQQEAEKNPGKYPEYIFPPHSIGGQTKGFSVVEATPEQTVNGILYWHPELKLKYMPIYETAKITEQYMKSK
jgi:hypothetical protein